MANHPHRKNPAYKPMLVEPPQPSTWGSCVSITPNLQQAYRDLLGPNLATCSFGRTSTSVQTLIAAQKILAYAPTHLIFIDHERHPHDLLKALAQVYGRRQFPQLFFHLYGDFTLYTHAWLKSTRLLKDKYVKFICASPRQRNFVAAFLRKPQLMTEVCHFPVAESEFGFDASLREPARSRWGIQEGEFTLVYTGRMSLQKNVLSLIKEISHCMQELEVPYRLLLAGGFDDMGSPFFGLRQNAGDYFSGYNKLFACLPKAQAERVQHIGQLGKSDLRELYHAADLFVSFSTHHDEDYGMSPIESLMCGTRALISSWGGYAGFALDDSCRLLPVDISRAGARVELKNLKSTLREMREDWPLDGSRARANRSQLYSRHFSLGAATEKIREILLAPPTRFAGFTEALRLHVALRNAMIKRGYMFSPFQRLDANYRKFYRFYSSDENKRVEK